MDNRELERQLRTVREPAPPPELAVRLERGIPDSFRQPESWRSPRRVWTMAKIGAATAAAVVVVGWLVVGLITVGPPGVTVVLAEVLAPVVEATGEARAVHMVLRMLTREGEDFTYVNLEDGQLRSVEVWLESPLREGDRGRARLEKSDRVYCFDGKESVLYFTRRKEAYRNTGFDSRFFWPSEWVRQVQRLPVNGAELLAHEEKHGEGRLLLRASGVPMKPLEPAFFDQFDRETEIVWDLATHRLKGLRRWVHYQGERRLFSELVSIEYPASLDEALFRLDLPSDVRWGGLKEQALSTDELGLGPREVAKRIFDAAIHRDRETLERYVPSPTLVDWFMTHSIEVVSVGEPFRAGNYSGYYVPYEVKVQTAGVLSYTKKHNLAVRNDNPRQAWELDGGW